MLAAILIALSCGAVHAQTDDGSEDAVAIFNQAQDAHERGDLADAITLYDKALKIVPEFPEAEYQRGMAELALEKKDEAERSFRRALALREDWSPALTSLGSLLIDLGRFGEAEPFLSKALAADLQNSAALAAMIDLQLSTNASPAVLKELLERASALTTKANPTASMWAARAALEAALDKRDAAKQSIANALAIDPQNRNALFLTGNIALSENDIVKAKEAANALEKLWGTSKGLNALRAGIAAAEGDTKLLAPDLEKELEADPKNAAVLGRLCSMLRREEPLKAIEYCRRASEAEPANLAHVIGYGGALVQAKQFDTAVILLRKVIGIAPDNSTARANLGTALFELKRYAEAREQFEWLTMKQPNLAAAYYYLAICLDHLGKYADAMANFQQFLRLADPVANKLDIEKVNLRLPALQKQIKKK